MSVDGSSDSPSAEDSSWLLSPPADVAEVADRYDAWAATYEHDLVQSWGYTAPFEATRLLAGRISQGPVLDLGCGTGLAGTALAAAGFVDLDGVDISVSSLEVARQAGCYRALVVHDFNASPLPFDDSTFNGAVSVGVLSYALSPVAVIRELGRVVTSGGAVVFTHRVDLWDAQDLSAELLAMRSSGLFSEVTWTDPSPYMPTCPDTAELKIRYVTALVG